MKNSKRSIAIDGPSGAGKSTLARLIAERIGFIYVDTGAIYRAVGLYAFKNGVARSDERMVCALLPEIDIKLKHTPDGFQHIYLNGEDVTDEIRQPEISLYASDVSKIPEVREFLLETQRELARKNDVIMDGRDIGTVVLPDADLKIFLTASPEDRSLRRFLELAEKGVDTSFEQVLEDIKYRDENDSSRAHAPLRPAEDAVITDTTGNSLEQSLNLLLTIVREKLNI
ncbi:MAG: (d)CMP kinase [Oscillospiraceae bacterium]|jgi:cytidylate kinase